MFLLENSWVNMSFIIDLYRSSGVTNHPAVIYKDYYSSEIVSILKLRNTEHGHRKYAKIQSELS